MEGASSLDAHPPEGSEVSVLPLEAFTQSLQVALTDLGIVRIDVRVSQGYGNKPTLERPEGGSVDASETSQEIPAAYPGESLDPSPDATMTCMGTDPVCSL